MMAKRTTVAACAVMAAAVAMGFPGDDGEEKAYALEQSGKDGSFLFTPIELT